MSVVRLTTMRTGRKAGIAAAISLLMLFASVLAAPPAAAGTVPDSPTGLIAYQVDDGVLGMEWNAPASSGSTSLVSYTVTTSPGGETCTTTDTRPGFEYCKIDGLTVGASYSFTVFATNGDGDGPASVPAAPVTIAPFVVPGAPSDVAVAPAAGATATAVSWTAAPNSGPPITEYTATARPPDYPMFPAFSCSTQALTCTIPGLHGGRFSFTVVAKNAAGQGLQSASTGTLNFVAPTAPTGIFFPIAAGRTSVRVQWAPVAAMAYPTTFTVTSSPGQHTCLTSTRFGCSVSGLSSTTSYTFTVTATNALGSSVSEPSAAITTAAPYAPPTARTPPRDRTPPAPVTSLAAVGRIAANATMGARLTWTAAADVASVKIGLLAGVRNPTPAQTVVGSAISISGASAVVSGLRPGVTYALAVYAVDAAGNVSIARSARLAGTTVAPAPLATSTAGQVVPVRFVLRDLGGKGLPGRSVDVLTRPATGGAWRVYRRLKTNAHGAVAVTPRLMTSSQFALRYAGESDRAGIPAGGLVTIRVRANVSSAMRVGTLPGTVAKRGARVTLTGAVLPAKPAQAVYLQRLVGTVWKNVAVARLTATSTYGFVLPTTAIGAARYRVLRPADRVNVAGTSAVHILTVT